MIKKSFVRRNVASIIAIFICVGVLGISYTPVSRYQVSAVTVNSRIRVDLNANDGRTASYTQNANNWIVTGTIPTATYDGVTFTLINGGSVGTGIRAASSKILTKSDGSTPTMTMDGVTIQDGENGGIIKLQISGLSAGTHTLTTWHSYFDNVTGSTLSVSVNGITTSGIKSVTRVKNDEDAGMSYTSFTATSGSTVTVLVKPEGNGSFNSAVLNAFEIDGADPVKSISHVAPVDGEKHLKIENGLSWTAGKNAVSHNVYIGTDYNVVNSATKSFIEYKANQISTKYALDDTYSSLNTYYWRVDEVSSDGSITKGAVMTFQVARLSFPTAEGYGRYARGGRGGRIIEVTNLNDSGAGSLRQALEVEKGARIVVFRVGGVIALKSALIIPNDGGDVYVAGQTAPGDGITLINYDFGALGSSDVVIRDVHVRVGDSNGSSTGGMGLGSCDNCIVDHCSISWATDEGFSSRSAKNITFQWNIIGESLNDSVHYNGNDRTTTEPHAFAASISGYVGSFHHNLLLDCTGRNWSLAGGMEQDGVTYGGNVDIRNNVVYNWASRTTDGGVRRLDFVNNYYKAGPESNTNMHIVSIDGNELGTYDMQMAYVSGNMMLDYTGKVLLAATDNAWDKSKAISGGKNSTVADVRSDTPFFESYVSTQSAADAYKSVIAGVGANAQGWDYIDSRYINEVSKGTYTYTGSKDGMKGIIDSQSDVGGYPNSSTFHGGTAPTDSDHDGMPDEWEKLHGLNANDADDGNVVILSADGYTNVEMYLNELAGDPVEYNAVDIEPINGTLIRSLLVNDTENYTDWSIQYNLNTGNVIYGDRTVTITAIPEGLKGVEWIRTACDSKGYQNDLATFTAGADISAFIMLDSRMTVIPTWLSGWTDTCATITASNDVVYRILQKDFDSGSEVILGSNTVSTGVINYFVAVSKRGTVSITKLKGDVNIDGKVDYLDVKLMKEYIVAKITELPDKNAADIDGNGVILSLDLALLKGIIISG